MVRDFFVGVRMCVKTSEVCKRMAVAVNRDNNVRQT